MITGLYSCDGFSFLPLPLYPALDTIITEQVTKNVDDGIPAHLRPLGEWQGFFERHVSPGEVKQSL